MSKSILLSICFVFAMSVWSCSSQITEEQVPVEVSESLQRQFPDVKIDKWDLIDEHIWISHFKFKGEETSVAMESNGKWIYTETEIDVLPEGVQHKFDMQFHGYEIDNQVRLIMGVDKGYELEVHFEIEKLVIFIRDDLSVIVKYPQADGSFSRFK